MISWFTTPLRHWKSFLPAWVALAATPYALLLAADSGRLNLYFWMIVAPILAAALWPFARLVARDEIGVMDRFVGLIGGTFCTLAVLAGAYQLIRTVAP